MFVDVTAKNHFKLGQIHICISPSGCPIVILNNYLRCRIGFLFTSRPFCLELENLIIKGSGKVN